MEVTITVKKNHVELHLYFQLTGEISVKIKWKLQTRKTCSCTFIACRWRQIYICISELLLMLLSFPGDFAACLTSMSRLCYASKREREKLLHTVCHTIHYLDLLSSKSLSWSVPLVSLMQKIFNLVKKITRSLHSSTASMYKEHNAVNVKFECQCKVKHIAKKCVLYYQET